MKRVLAMIVAGGLLSVRSAQAFQGLATRLSLERPYGTDVNPPKDVDDSRSVDAAFEGTGRRVHFRQMNNPEGFDLFHYVRGADGGLQIAVFFK